MEVEELADASISGASENPYSSLTKDELIRLLKEREKVSMNTGSDPNNTEEKPSSSSVGSEDDLQAGQASSDAASSPSAGAGSDSKGLADVG